MNGDEGQDPLRG